MFKIFISGVTLLVCLAIPFQNSGAQDFNQTNFSAGGRKWQPAPVGHIPGKDNGTGIGRHKAGEDCGICHRPNGKAKDYIFSMSGTLYEDRAGRKPLKGGEVILQDAAGKIISMTSNETGNFWTYEPIGSNPRAMVSYGGKTSALYKESEGVITPAAVDDTRSWQYKTWVKNNDQVIPMVTVAPVGGYNDATSRMSCNMHHARLGNRGGLWVSRRSTLNAYPAQHPGFKKHIQPILRNKCAPCHIPGDTWTRIVTQSDYEADSKIDYSNAMDLTTYKGSNVTVNNKAWVKRGAGDPSLVLRNDPTNSPLLLKTKAGGIQHAGGWFWTTQDDDYRVLLQWIREGALNN